MRDLAEITAPILSARGLRFSAGGARLVRDVDLDLAEGRITLLMGANGAGKSLLLRLLHGLLRPEAGTLSWRGGTLDAAARRAQAMAFQRPVLLRRSARANLGFAAKALRIPRAERAARVETALAEARLSAIANRPARRLSGGEQQRLALARALLARPALLFLDEPTASLDPASTALIEERIRAAHAAGATVLMATHDKGQAARLGQEIIFLEAGRVVETGPAQRVLNAPASDPARAWMAGRLYPHRKPEEFS